MNNDRFIILLERHFDGELTADEKIEFNRILEDEKYRSEFEEQKKVKEVLKKMNLKNPTKEFWDGYWLNTYNKLERGIAWIFISIGVVLLIGYAAIELVDRLFTNDGGPLVIKIGLTALFFGSLVLIFSLLREKLFTRKNDKYKEIQR